MGTPGNDAHDNAFSTYVCKTCSTGVALVSALVKGRVAAQ